MPVLSANARVLLILACIALSGCRESSNPQERVTGASSVSLRSSSKRDLAYTEDPTVVSAIRRAVFDTPYSPRHWTWDPSKQIGFITLLDPSGEEHRIVLFSDDFLVLVGPSPVRARKVQVGRLIEAVLREAAKPLLANSSIDGTSFDVYTTHPSTRDGVDQTSLLVIVVRTSSETRFLAMDIPDAGEIELRASEPPLRYWFIARPSDQVVGYIDVYGASSGTDKQAMWESLRDSARRVIAIRETQ